MLPSAAVIPAAGRSRRMGRPKPLLPWKGTTVIGRVLGALSRGGVDRIVVVLREDDETLADWLEAEWPAVDRVVNRAPDEGMLHSVRIGLASLDAAPDPLLVCPADLPELDEATVAALLEVYRTERPGILVPVAAGRRGHPLLIAPDLQPQIDRLDPAVGLKQLLRIRAEAVRSLTGVGPGTVRDVDTPEELAALAAASRGER